MIKLLELLDSLIVEVEASMCVPHSKHYYALDLCLIHLRIARTILNSPRLDSSR